MAAPEPSSRPWAACSRRYWEGVTPKASLNARLNTEKEVNPASMAMVVTGRSLRASSHFTRSSRVRRL